MRNKVSNGCKQYLLECEKLLAGALVLLLFLLALAHVKGPLAYTIPALIIAEFNDRRDPNSDNQIVEMQGFVSSKYRRQGLELLPHFFRTISAPFSPNFFICSQKNHFFS